MREFHPRRQWTFTLVLLGTLSVAAQDSDPQPQKREVVAYHTNSPIVLDGVLDEADWAEADVRSVLSSGFALTVPSCFRDF